MRLVSMRRVISIGIMLLVAGFGSALTTAANANAQASCDSTTNRFKDTANNTIVIPSIGHNTTNIDCDLGVGDVSSAVKDLQHELNHCYWFLGISIAEDGIFGQHTKAALEKAQSFEGITADGVYGPQTRNHLHWLDSTGFCFRLL